MANDQNSTSFIQDDNELDQSSVEAAQNDRGNIEVKGDESPERLDEINQTSAAIHAANNPETKKATKYRDPSRQPSRANEATDRNDTGSGDIIAGGVKSGSSLQ